MKSIQSLLINTCISYSQKVGKEWLSLLSEFNEAINYDSNETIGKPMACLMFVKSEIWRQSLYVR